MKPIKVVYFFIISLLIISCEKESNSSENRQAQLDCRIIQDETIFNNDTSYKSVNKFYYSGDLLIRKTGGNQFYTHYEQTYHYDQNERLIYILISHLYNQSIDTINTFKYNNAGQLIQIASYNDNIAYEVLNFKYVGSKLNELESVYDNIETNKFRIITDNNNNIIEAYSLSLSSQNVNLRYTFTYDNFKNPYQGIYDQNSSILEYFGSNNLIKTESYENGVLQESSSFTYNFNQHGFPISVLDNDIGYSSFKTINYECF